MMTSSVFGAKQHISKWSSALAVQTRRHRKKKPRDPKCLARSACQYLQPTRVRMVTTLPTESQRYRGNGVLRESQLFAKKKWQPNRQPDNQTKVVDFGKNDNRAVSLAVSLAVTDGHRQPNRQPNPTANRLLKSSIQISYKRRRWTSNKHLDIPNCWFVYK